MGDPIDMALVNATLKHAKEKYAEEMVGEMSALLFGAVAFVMVIFYLVNSRAKLIRETTWDVINLSVSIFVAVLSYNVVSRLINLAGGLKEEEEGTALLTCKFLQLIGWWLFVVIVLFIMKDNLLQSKAHGTIGGHILGFAAISAFGNLAQSGWFNESPWRVLLVLLIYFVVFTMLFFSSYVVRVIFEKVAPDDEDGMDTWHDQVKDTGTDFFSMGTAFLIVFFIRWKLHDDKIVTIDGELGVATDKAWILIGLGWIFVIIAGLVHVGHHYVPHGAMDYVSTTTSITAAFLLIFGYMWKLGDAGHSELSGQVSVVVTLCAIAVCFILLVTWVKNYNIPRKILKAGHTAMALAVGLGWEKVFDKAMDGFAEKISSKATPGREQLTVIFLTAALICVVFPGWMLYILPKVDDDIQKKYKKALADGPFPLSACCCSADLDDDNYDADEDDELE